MRPVKVVIRDMPNSPAIEQHVRRKAEKLAQFYNHINSFHIVIEVPQKHQRQGKLYAVKIDLHVPGKDLVVNKKIDEDVYIAIRDAFDALIRQLETYTRRRRGDVKAHNTANFGVVSKLFQNDGYGFIQSVNGEELYFSMTNVAFPTFDQLAVGDSVEFLGMQGADGMQAHHVTKGRRVSEIEH